jgi:uridine kinase
VPVERRATLEQKRVDEIAVSMLDWRQQTTILMRSHGASFVLVEGLHRLEAGKALGEKTFSVFLSTRGNTEVRRLSFGLADCHQVGI